MVFLCSPTPSSQKKSTSGEVGYPGIVVIYAFKAGRDWVSHIVFVVLTIQNHSM
ncbi:hypothetical protein HMPREF9374_1934 [Desmospora sp. 8437]|nr:hypothetical protein HMPREF9374_1934 [Desmospora sp. 8437]